MAIVIKAGHKYQTRNGRVVVINEIVDGGVNDKGEALPPYGKGEIKGEGLYVWSMSGGFKNGTHGVPNAFDLEHEAGVA